MIQVKDITYRYQESEDATPQTVLEHFSLTVEEGSFTAILGHNGSGKSTLAKLLNSTLQPESGSILIDGLDTQNPDQVLDVRRSVGVVFQNPDNQIVATIVEEDVAFGPENLGVPPEEIRRRVDEALAAVNMSDYKTHAPHLLSGGQKQRIAIAGILAMRPKYLVLDEPTAMLDPVGRREVMDSILKLNKEHGMTVLLITHYMDEAALADRVVVLDEGKIQLDAPPHTVFAQVERMKGLGLDVPQATAVLHQLRGAGVVLPDCALTEDECLQALLPLLQKETAHD